VSPYLDSHRARHGAERDPFRQRNSTAGDITNGANGCDHGHEHAYD
jgi:hypothetical protein